MNVILRIYRQRSVKKPTSKNTPSNNTFHIFTLFTTLPTSTLANFKIEQKSSFLVNNRYYDEQKSRNVRITKSDGLEMTISEK